MGKKKNDFWTYLWIRIPTEKTADRKYSLQQGPPKFESRAGITQTAKNADTQFIDLFSLIITSWVSDSSSWGLNHVLNLQYGLHLRWRNNFQPVFGISVHQHVKKCTQILICSGNHGLENKNDGNIVLPIGHSYIDWLMVYYGGMGLYQIRSWEKFYYILIQFTNYIVIPKL